MTDYNAISETETDPGAPSRSSLWKRWAKNWIAGFEGAAGAPRLLGEAIARAGNGLPVLTVAAADSYNLDEGAAPVAGTLVTASTSLVVAYTWTISAFTGSIRVRADHSAAGGSRSILEVWKNGVFVAQDDNIVGSILTDVTIAPGDVVQLRHRINSGAGPSTVANISARASNAYVAQSAFRKAV